MSTQHKGRGGRRRAAAGASAAAAAASASAPAAPAAAVAALSTPPIRTAPIVLAKPVFVSVDSLEPEVKGKNLVVQVLEVRSVSGNGKHRVAEVLVGDSTGSIVLTLEGAAQVSCGRVGFWLYLRNAHVAMVHARMRLAVSSVWGVVESVPPSERAALAATQVRRDNNLSETEYELITLPA